jgi:hypothetical protein
VGRRIERGDHSPRRSSLTFKFYGRPRHDARSQKCRCSLWVQGSLGPDFVRISLKLTVREATQQIVRGCQAKAHRRLG